MQAAKRIGVDESGKGDYFGYLVIAGVIADDKTESRLKSLGVKDSKKLLDSAALRLATAIKKVCVNDVVKISPEKYNHLYKKFYSNLNNMLAWGHAQVIENLLKKDGDVAVAISDKFGDESLLKDALKKKSVKIKLIQKVRAEENVAVAAASILARAEFLRTLRRLSLEVGYKLPKGSTDAEAAAKELIGKYGKEHVEKLLPMIAKMHFKITKRVMKK